MRRIGWAIIILLALLTATFTIGRFVVVTREGVLAAKPAESGIFDDRYNRHPLLSYLHIVPGLVFMVLGPLQFVNGIRTRWLNFHRWSGRIYLACSMTAALSSLVIAIRFPAFGGWTTGIATYFFGTLFVFCLVKAFYHIRRKQIGLHREWMIRAFAIGLGVSTIRVVVLFMEIFTRLEIVDSFGIAFWIGFSLNTIAAEVWINLTRGTKVRTDRSLLRKEALDFSE